MHNIFVKHTHVEKNLINTPYIFPEAHRTESICLAAEPYNQSGHTRVLE